LRFQKNHDQSPSHLKELMTALPMTVEEHAAIRRKKVETRRTIEDALDAVKQRRDAVSDR
jgi:hypothetical protein